MSELVKLSNCQDRSPGRKHKLRLLLSAGHYECRSHPKEDHCSDLNKTQFKEFAGGFVLIDLTYTMANAKKYRYDCEEFYQL